MDWLTNEVLFYGGIIMVSCSLFAALVSFFVFKIRKLKLETRLDAEYGKKVKTKSK